MQIYLQYKYLLTNAYCIEYPEQKWNQWSMKRKRQWFSTKKGCRYEEPDWKWGDRGSRRKWVKILPLAFPRQHVEGAHTTPRQCGGGFVIVPEIKCPIFQVETKHKMPLPTIHRVKSHIQTDSRLFWHNSEMKIWPLIWGGGVQSNFHQGLLGSSNVNTGKKLQTSRGTGHRSTGRPCVSFLREWLASFKFGHWDNRLVRGHRGSTEI